MISGKDFYVVLTAVVPLYVAMILAYGSVRWWKIFTPDQCSGINRFVSVFAVPLLSFKFISQNNLYTLDVKFLAADFLQKAIMLVVLAAWANLTKSGSFEWSITLFSLSTIPNTLVMGIPMFVAMYGDFSSALMVQLIVFQCLVWYTLLLFLYEFRAAKMLISEQFPTTAASIVSLKVDDDVVSLDGQDFIETGAEIGSDGMLHVTVRKSNASRRRPSINLTAAEIIYSRSSASSRNGATPRNSSVNHSDLHSMMGMGRLSNFGNSDTGRMSSSSIIAELYSGTQSSRGAAAVGPDQQSAGAKEVRLVVNEGVSQPGREDNGKEEEEKQKEVSVGAGKQMPPFSVMIRLILTMVWRKLIRNPNTYASIIGLIWSLISFRWNVEMPKIIAASIKILSDTGLGLAMFTLGLFMALQPKLIPCGKRMAALSMAVRFLLSPAVMAAASYAVGLRGILLQIAIVQAALPQALVPFVFAKEYNVHAQILSTAVIFGMLIALPIVLVYYILLGL